MKTLPRCCMLVVGDMPGSPAEVLLLGCCNASPMTQSDLCMCRPCWSRSLGSRAGFKAQAHEILDVRGLGIACALSLGHELAGDRTFNSRQAQPSPSNYLQNTQKDGPCTGYSLYLGIVCHCFVHFGGQGTQKPSTGTTK